MPVQQQSNVIDCGLFDIAIATDLLYGNSPSNVSYEHEKMFICLQDCLSIYKIRSHYFEEQLQKLARQEVLRTI